MAIATDIQIQESQQERKDAIKTGDRDIQLDMYRALAMIYVLCVVHVTFWLKGLSEPLSSIILFEMPVIFFISGASLRVSNKRKKMATVIKNRAQRVLTPYYAYAFCCIILYIAASMVIDIPNYKPLSYVIPNSLLPDIHSVPIPYNTHLWFILPYLIISCSFCFQQKITDSMSPYLYLGIILLTCVITQLATDNLLIRNIVFFNFFFMAGYLFYKQLSIKQVCIIAVSSAAVFAAMYLIFWKGSIQAHKFPCDMLFLTYGILALSILALIFTYVKLPQNRMLKRWNEHGYTIYLWQNFAFCVVAGILMILPEPYTTGGIGFLLKASLIFILVTLMSYIVVPLETILTKAMTLTYNKIGNGLKALFTRK